MSAGLVVVLFAGGGGADLGIEAALGRPVDIAINHDPEALAMHAVNFPRTRHLCEDIWRVDPVAATGGRPVDILWASPDCKHFSRAKGGRPVSPRVRGLAWMVVRWAARTRPRVIFLENVEEFRTWGPLLPDGRPDKSRSGVTFDLWVSRLRSLGYAVEWRMLSACDFGAPTTRRRFFLVARRDGRPIRWPEPTHRPEAVNEDGIVTKWAVGHGLTLKDLQRLPSYRTAAEIIDWSLPCPSIFLSPEEAKKLGVRRPLADQTLRRIAAGVKKFVIDAAEPFVVTYYGPKRDDEFRGCGLDEPLPTQTTENRHALVTPCIVPIAHYNGRDPVHGADKPLTTITAYPEGGHHALVSAFLAQHNGGPRNDNLAGRPMDAPLSTVTATGSQQGLVVAHMQRDFGQSVGHGMDAPCGSVTADGGGHCGLVTSHLVKMRGTCRHGAPVAEPVPAVTAGGMHLGEVRAFLTKFYGPNVGQDMRGPLHTVTTLDRFGLVTVRGALYEIVDIGLRMLTPRELYRAQGFPEWFVIGRTALGPLTKKAQVRMCGNSVPPDEVEALVWENCADMAREAA